MLHYEQKASGTGEGDAPRCRRGCSPVSNTSFPGAGEVHNYTMNHK